MQKLKVLLKMNVLLEYSLINAKLQILRLENKWNPLCQVDPNILGDISWPKPNTPYSSITLGMQPHAHYILQYKVHSLPYMWQMVITSC